MRSSLHDRSPLVEFEDLVHLAFEALAELGMSRLKATGRGPAPLHLRNIEGENASCSQLVNGVSSVLGRPMSDLCAEPSARGAVVSGRNPRGELCGRIC